MARDSRPQFGAVWVVVVALVASFGTGHTVGVAHNRPAIATTGLTTGDRSGAAGGGIQEAAAAGQGWAPVTLTSPSRLLYLGDFLSEPQTLERVSLSAARSAPLQASVQSSNIRFGGEFRNTVKLQPLIAFTPHDDWSLVPDIVGLQAAGNRLFDRAEDPGELRGTGQLVAQGQPPSEAQSEEAKEENLATQLANPISTLISVPFQSNFNFGIGPTQGGFQYLLNIQPVYPASMNEAWNFITRMILPVVYQNQIFPGAGSQLGLGDTTFQFFFSPKEPTKGGIIWGVGPTLFVPTGTDPLLSARTWGAGLDGVVLTQLPQKGGVLTLGILASQTWSFAGPTTINSAFLQPFIAFTFPNTVTINLQSQSTLNWNTGQWTVPIIASVSKIFKFGDQLTSLGFGVKYYPVSPVGQPTWGLQTTVTLLFPTR